MYTVHFYALAETPRDPPVEGEPPMKIIRDVIETATLTSIPPERTVVHFRDGRNAIILSAGDYDVQEYAYYVPCSAPRAPEAAFQRLQALRDAVDESRARARLATQPPIRYASAL